jgi:uncharacterized membrane protein
MDDFTKRWLIIILVIVLMLGVFFRISNLGTKPVWAGEAHTLSVISGYSESEVIDKISTAALAAKVVNVESFLKYRYPNGAKNINDILPELYADSHPPLYFLLARYWVELFGYSITTLRSMSAVLSLLAVPCIYWLCLELFGIPTIGWMGSALFSVSPIQVIYAHEAGSFSLFSSIVLLSSASLLWALRTQRKLAWITYTVSLALGFYCQYFFVFIVIGYCIYVLSIESFRLTSKLHYFFLTKIFAFLAFSPWIFVVTQHFPDFKELFVLNGQNHLTLLGAIALWDENISLAFIDLVDPKAIEYGGFGKFCFYFLTPLILCLFACSIYLLRVKTPKQVYLFVFVLLGSTAFPLIVFDLVLGQNQEIWPENLCAFFLGIQICIAYLLSTKALLSDFTARVWQRKYWLPIATILMTEGVIFCSIFLQADTWWNKYGSEDILSFTQIIQQVKDPLILVNRQHPESLIFYNLQPQVKLLFVEDRQLKVNSFEGMGNIFFLNPNLNMQAKLKLRHYQFGLLAQYSNFDRVYDGLMLPQLWKLRKLNN